MPASFQSRLEEGAYWEDQVALRFSEAGFCVIVSPQAGCWKDSVDLLVGPPWVPVEVKSNGPRIHNGVVLVASERSFNQHGGKDSLYAHWVFINRYGQIRTLPRGCPVIRGHVITDRARGYSYPVVMALEAYLGDFQKLCTHIRR
jgi:hypothetical protein